MKYECIISFSMSFIVEFNKNSEIVIVDNIWQVLEHTLVENEIDFQMY